MSRYTQFISKFGRLFDRRAVDQRMNEEMQSHVEFQTQEYIAAGMTPEAARTAAFREFGRMEAIKESCRDQRGIGWIENTLRDARFAVRMLLKNPGFATIAILTVALCLGANLAIFAVTDAIMLRPLPFPNPERLVTMYNTYPKAGVERDGSSLPNYYERRGAIPSLPNLSIYNSGTAIVGDTGATELEDVIRVSPDFFTTLGVHPRMGRDFTEEETTYQTDGVAILTDTSWRQRFNADTNILGRAIRVDGSAKTIVGVLPADFQFLSSRAKIYLPLASNPDQRAAPMRHSGNGSDIVARLAPGATIAVAQAQIEAQNAALAGTYPQAKMIAEAGFRTVVGSLRGDHIKSVRPILILIQAGALFLLLVGGINLANLLLIRASNRLKEFGIRQSLGAGQKHVAGQIVAETLLLTLLGGALGLGVGALGIRSLAVLGVEQLPLGTRVNFDQRLALVAFIGAILLGLAIAIPIIWFTLRGHVAYTLRSESRTGTSDTSTQRIRHGFMVAQIALSFVLLATASVLGLSLKRLMAVSPGFQADHVLTGRITLPWKNYRDENARLAFVERLLESLARVPGITSAGVINNIPLSGNTMMSALTVQGYTPPAGESVHGHYSYGVTGDYFRAMGIPLREGRLIDASDCRRNERVCVIDEDFARRYFPGGHAIGQHLFQGSVEGAASEAFTIVGIVGVVKPTSLSDTQRLGAAYLPYTYRTDNSAYVALHTSLPPESLAATLQRVVRELDPELPVNNLRSMDGRITDSLVARRSPALLGAIFACVALILAAIGTYGVLSYAVGQRRREIGVRLALGAQRRQIAGQFLSLNLRLLTIGVVLGVLGTWLASRALQNILFNTGALPLEILVATGSIVAAVSVAACLIPVRRAIQIAPMEALRSE